MKDRVVCIDDSNMGTPPDPIKGEIYTIDGPDTFSDGFVFLVEFTRVVMTRHGMKRKAYRLKCFRPVDDTFGPAVCEIIEKQVEVEQHELV